MTELVHGSLTMLFELLVAEYIFSSQRKRRERFYLRFLGTSGICYIITYFLGTAFERFLLQSVDPKPMTFALEYLYNFAFYQAVFGMSIVCVRFSYCEVFPNLLLDCTGSYLAQYLASNVTYLIRVIVEAKIVKIIGPEWIPVRMLIVALIYGCQMDSGGRPLRHRQQCDHGL